jgi:periplasmic divalent cation tolerance protein
MERGRTAGPDAAAAEGGVDARLLLVAAPDQAVAEQLVTRLVEDGVVACGSILPGMLSIYRWRGALEQAREVLVLLKTTRAGARLALERVPALHPYEVPEILVLAVEDGHAPYLEWVAGSVGTLQERD